MRKYVHTRLLPCFSCIKVNKSEVDDLKTDYMYHMTLPIHVPGADPGGVAHDARPPKIGKNMIFWRKIVIFHTKYPKNVRASLRNWKKYDFLA